MPEALRRESITSGPYENVAPLFQQQKNNRSVSQYARPNTIDNAPSILTRYNSNRSSRPHSSGSFTSQDFYKNFTETRNTGNANQKSTIRVSSNDFSDDESIYDNEPIKIVGSTTLREQEYATPAELPQSHILKERLLEHIQGHHTKKHRVDVQAALNDYFSSNTTPSKKTIAT